MTATQAPTPGPLSKCAHDGYEVDTAGQPVRCAECGKSLAPTAPVEASGSEREAAGPGGQQTYTGYLDGRAPSFTAADDTTPARAEAQDEGAAAPSFRDVFLSWHEECGTVERAGPCASPIGKFEARWPDFRKRLWDAAMKSPDALRDEWVKIAKECAHPSPTPAADADRVRIAVEALEPFAHIASHVGLPKDDTVHVTALDGQWIATVRREDFWNARQALAALKSEGK